MLYDINFRIVKTYDIGRPRVWNDEWPQMSDVMIITFVMILVALCKIIRALVSLGAAAPTGFEEDSFCTHFFREKIILYP